MSARLRKYGAGTGADIYIPIVKAGVNDFAVAADWTPAAGDVKVSKDGAAAANIGTLPVHVTDNGWKLVFTDAELQAKKTSINIVDSAAKAIEDQHISIETYGHASAQHAFDLNTAEQQVDAVKISGDGTAADNIEAQYDGTGYTDPKAPSTQEQLDSIAVTGSAVNRSANSDSTVTTGSVAAGTYASTEALDASYWQIQDAAGEIDMYLETNIGSIGIPTGAKITGRVNGVNDDLKVYAWNWVSSAWNQIGTLDGQAGSTDFAHNYDLLVNHVGTGANVGKVRIRFQNTGLTSANFYIDQFIFSYSVNNQSTGYADGAIWIDTNNGSAGTVSYINGTADNPVDTWADALTIAGNLNMLRFRIIGGSAITLSANSDNYAIIGSEYTLALNGQSIANAYIEGATVSGTSAGNDARFMDCKMGTCSLTQCGMGRCALMDTITLLSAGTYIFEGCFSAVAGTATPGLDFGAAIANTNVNFRHHSGGIEVENIGASGTDNMSLEGFGQLVLNANCAGGTIAIRGCFTVTDNASGAVTLSDDARYDVTQINDTVDALKTAFADELLKRGVSNTEGSADATSLTALILAAFESTIAGTVWTIRKTTGATFTTKAVTTDPTAEPVTGVN